MKRAIVFMVLASLVLFEMSSSAWGNDYNVPDLRAGYAPLFNAELIYEKGPIALYRVPLESPALVAAAQPSTIVANAEVYGTKEGEPLWTTLLDTTMRPVFISYFLLNTTAHLTVQIQVAGPQKINVNYTTEDPIDGGYYYYTILYTQNKPHKKTGTYSCTITVTAQGKPNDPELSKETCRYFVQAP